MEPPAWFESELKAFDADLRIRWSSQREHWLIERKVRRALHPGTIKGSDWDDDFTRARDGFLLVGVVSPTGLSRGIFEKLRNSDLWSNGGWARIANQMEEYDKSREEKSWAKFSENIQDDSKDVYEFLKRRDGRTVFSPGWVD